MSALTGDQFARMLAARERLITFRSERKDQLVGLRAFCATALTEFVANCDPISGQRFVDVSGDGNKARGDLTISVSFFEGTKFSIGVDHMAQFAHASEPGRLLGDIGQVVGIQVEPDLSGAKIHYMSVGSQPERRVMDVADLIAATIATAVESVEADVREAPALPASAAQREESPPLVA